MATFWKRSAHSVYRMNLCITIICNFSYSHFVFEGMGLVLIASVIGH